MGFFSAFGAGASKSWQNDANVAKAVGGLFSGIKGIGFREKLGYSLGRASSPATLLVGGAVTAAVVGVGAYMAMTPRGREFREDDVPVKPIPPMLTPQDLMLQPMPQELAGPAEGRGEFEFRNRVRADRGLGPEQVGAAQPRMSVTDSVTDLGAPNKTLSV